MDDEKNANELQTNVEGAEICLVLLFRDFSHPESVDAVSEHPNAEGKKNKK